MRRFGHPSRADLQAWLDGTKPDIDEHVATCDRCANSLEDLATPPDGALAAALSQVYEPPGDLSERLERRVADRLDSRIMFDVVSDLFGAGLETSRLLLTEEPPHE